MNKSTNCLSTISHGGMTLRVIKKKRIGPVLENVKKTSALKRMRKAGDTAYVDIFSLRQSNDLI